MTTVMTKNVRTTLHAEALISDKVNRANKRREKQKKAPISKSKAYEMGAKALKIKDLVET